MNNRIDAIYARQSVDKKDSISIESQIEFCKYELKGGNCKEYTGQRVQRQKHRPSASFKNWCGTSKAGLDCEKSWFTSSTVSAVPFWTLPI